MRAIILAGGKGRRLAPYTVTFPKPLVPVGDMPILEIVIRQLASSGFDHITLATGHLAELLMAYFGDGSKWGVRIDYSREDQPLGTVGPLGLIDDLPETFLVMNGDILTTLRYDTLYNYHQSSQADLTIACHRCNIHVDLGVIEFNGQHEVTGYREKPTIPYDASMGVYMFQRSVVESFVSGRSIDFPTVVAQLVSRQANVKVFLSECLWLDIGRPSDYEKASQIFLDRMEEFLPEQRSDEEFQLATRNGRHS